MNRLLGCPGCNRGFTKRDLDQWGVPKKIEASVCNALFDRKP